MVLPSPFIPVSGISASEIVKLLHDSILTVPTVSAGNVPQLTTDLLIYSLGLKLVGRLSEQYLYPFAGPRDAPEGVSTSGISTPVEGMYIYLMSNSLLLILTLFQSILWKWYYRCSDPITNPPRFPPQICDRNFDPFHYTIQLFRNHCSSFF